MVAHELSRVSALVESLVFALLDRLEGFREVEDGHAELLLLQVDDAQVVEVVSWVQLGALLDHSIFGDIVVTCLGVVAAGVRGGSTVVKGEVLDALEHAVVAEGLQRPEVRDHAKTLICRGLCDDVLELDRVVLHFVPALHRLLDLVIGRVQLALEHQEKRLETVQQKPILHYVRVLRRYRVLSDVRAANDAEGVFV